ncbi:MAG TPA: small ribosomal subunit Rsm22 family protein [Opitutaceae bacterium]
MRAEPSPEPYWESDDELADYDATFGERIGWKWDAVIDELRRRRWAPRGGTLLDWGCGSGIASRRVLAAFGAATFDSLVTWDHSPLASEFARRAAEERFPGLEVAAATSGFLSGGDQIGLLVVSHVVNELPPSALDEIRLLVARSAAVLWVEAGARETSRALGALRDAWSRDFTVVAPCTHGNLCPILSPGNEPHWCHHFACPPPGIFADSHWVKFAQRAGIDLRSLPYSFIALDRKGMSPETGLSRIIGRPEHFKPYVRFLNCDSTGLAELTVAKRANAALCKELARPRHPLVYRWIRDGGSVTGGTALPP